MNSHNDNLDISDSEEVAARWCMRIVEGPLSHSDQIEFERWIVADEHNARLFERMIAVWQYSNAIADMPGFLALRAKALAAMGHGQAQSRLSRSPSRRALLAAVAGFGMFALIGSWSWMTGPDVYATAIGERRSVQLSDGSSISLDAASQISVSFTEDRRSIILDQGRAKFDVAKDSLRPFTVTAGSQAVVAIGTSFSVELLQDQLRVLLFEGKVDVVPQLSAARLKRDARVSKNSSSLEPGQELVATLTSGAGKILEADVDRSLSWEEGRLDFIDVPLSQAVERFNRYSTIPIVIDDAAAGRNMINGVFDTGDTDSFIVGITSLYDLSSHKYPSAILIKSVKNKDKI